MGVVFDPVTELYRTERAGLARSVAKIAGGERADDLVHDAFVAYLARSPWVSRPAAWLSRVARNRALNEARRLRRLLPAEVAFEVEEPGRGADRDSVRSVVSAALAGLPERCRLALRMRYFGGHDYKEIAGALGVRVEQAHVVVHRAVRRLGREVVRRLADAHGASTCAPALARMSGIANGDGAGHEPGPCATCRPAWEEIVALRGLPGLVPAIPVHAARMRRLVGRASARASAVAEPVERVSSALVALGVAASATLGVPGTLGAGHSRSAAAAAIVGPAQAPARSTASVGLPPPSPTVRPVKHSPRVAAARVRTPLVNTGAFSVAKGDDHVQAEVERGGTGSGGVVVCQPLQPCPPSPSPSPSP